jgi:excisionase family DNA binding protein
MTTEEFRNIIKETVSDVIHTELTKNQSVKKDGPLISITQAAILLGVSKVTIWNYRKKGIIKDRKIGRRILFDKEELLEATKHS